MSRGDLDPSRKPWGQIDIDPNALLGAVSKQVLAVANAEGDVVGANENLRQEVALAQGRVDSAEETLEKSQQDVLERLRRMDLLGRRMELRSGTAIAEISEDGHGGFKAEPSSQDLSNANGVLAGFEVGAVMDEPLEDAGAIVLMIATDADSSVPQGVYAFSAEDAGFVLEKIPEPGEQPD